MMPTTIRLEVTPHYCFEMKCKDILLGRLFKRDNGKRNSIGRQPHTPRNRNLKKCMDTVIQ